MSTAIEPRKVAKSVGTLKELLLRPDVRSSIASVLPRTMTPERLLKVALATVSRSPQLVDCDQMSILKSLMVAAELGLDPSGTLGQGYLVPFKNSKTGRKECQFIPGYRGLISLSRRSGEVKSIYAELVYSCDDFNLTKGLHPNIEHTPNYDATPTEKDIVGAYAVAVFRDGTSQFEYMPRREIDGIRKRSKASNNGPWVTDFGEMAKKTVVRRLCKYLPLSVEEPLAKAVEVETAIELGNSAGEVLDVGGAFEVLEGSPISRSEALAHELGSTEEPESTPERAQDATEKQVNSEALDATLRDIEQMTSLTDLKALRETLEATDMPSAEKSLLTEAIDARWNAVRGKRGTRSNDGQLFPAGGNATAEGH